MSDDKNPKGGPSGYYDWSEYFRQILRNSEVMRQHDEAVRAVANQLTTSASFAREIAALQEATRKSIDLSGFQVALNWYTQNQKVVDSITEMARRSYPLIELNLRKVNKAYPTPSKEQPDATSLEEALAAFEAAREEAGGEPASKLEKFFEDDARLDEDVTGLASLTNIEDPLVQERIKKIIRWIIDLTVVALIAGNTPLAATIAGLLGLFGVSTKDVKAIADKAVQKIIDAHLEDKEDDDEE
ncbi:hypothetical protein [Paenarthrobacter nitroguajacolicus]|uniref:hypothetical protein n=1 Tax=Paenarthrobacter nitroguajacolicus TaxID=211146 RepID=UPI003440CF0F